MKALELDSRIGIEGDPDAVMHDRRKLTCHPGNKLKINNSADTHLPAAWRSSTTKSSPIQDE